MVLDENEKMLPGNDATARYTADDQPTGGSLIGKDETRTSGTLPQAPQKSFIDRVFPDWVKQVLIVVVLSGVVVSICLLMLGKYLDSSIKMTEDISRLNTEVQNIKDTQDEIKKTIDINVNDASDRLNRQDERLYKLLLEKDK